MKVLCKIIYKTTIILIILGFFINSFANLPFKKIQAQLGNLESNEVILNEEYGDEEDILIEEIEEMRNTNSKVFKTNSGKYEYHYYDNIIHSYDEEIGFTEIDSSFEEISNEYSSNSLKYNVKVPKKITENKKIKLSYENTKLELKYNDIYKQTGTIISNENNDISSLNHLIGTVKYENIYDNVDLELITNSTSLKENVILNNFIDNFSFSYNISLTNLKLVNENNYINFYDNNEKLIYQINPYFMFDKNNNISYDLIVEIEEIKKNNYQITVIPDNTFLLNASYPVTIDPTITYRYNLIDDYIQIKNFKKGNITSNYQNYVSVTKFIDISTNENMSEVSIMKLDVSQLPKNVMYSSAELRMYSYSDCCKTEDICLYNITSSNFDFNSVKGTTSYYKSYITKQEKLTTNWYSFDILNAIKGDNDDILYLEFSGEKLSRNDVQAKFEGFDNYSYGPMLVFKYYETSGIKDYWTYHSTSLGNAGTMYINDFSGNLVVERVDYENPGERMSFNIVQYYNSFESDVNIGYGNGWRFNYCDFIKNFTSLVGVNSNDYYTHVDGTGHKSYYEFQRQLNPNIASSGLYYCEDGDDSIIEIGASENDYYRRIVDGEYVYKYNTYGELILIAKNDSSFTETAIFIEYTELSNNQRVISKISDVVRNSATFYYNEDNLLEEIEIKRKKIEDEVSIYEVAYRIFYTYDDENNLKRVSKTAKDSSKIQTEVVYTYNDNNKLSVMKNELSRSLNNSKEEIYFWYDSNNEKVDRYQYEIYDLNIGSYVEGFPYVDIIYETYKTIFESSDGHKSYYSFDRYGHTINVYDNDGYAKFYKYEFDNENNFLNNKLLEESESVYYKYNKITNHGFENYDSNNSIIGWTTSGNVTLNSINKLFGEYSLELTSSTSYASQTVQLYGNTTYKLSSFIKVKSIDDYVSGGAYIDITAQNSNGNIITSQTEYIAPNDEFEEYIKEFTVGGYDNYPYLVTITLRTSINTNVYFDNVQFITSINDCRYNMLEDNSFENSYITSNSKWTGGQTVECEPSEAFGKYNRYIPSKSILKQVLDINISQGTKVSFGGFALTNGNKTSIRVRFYNLETDTYSDYYVINYNKEVSGYQFLMDNVEVTLEGGCHQIEYEVINNGNIGIYVDNLILMQDVFTNQYEYNVVGKPSKKLTPEEIIEFIRDSGTNRKIQQIRIEKNDTLTLVNYEESTTQKTVNIDGSINNITTTTYSNNEVVPNATVVGTFETKYFTTTTEYSHSSQFISKTTDEFNNETKYEYDYLSGLLTKVTDAKNIDTTYEYDYYERITKITKDSNVIEYTYNNNGQIEKVRTGNDTLYIEYYFEYNEYLDIKKISSSSNTTEGYKTIIEYQYYLKDGLYTGEIEKIINANGSYILYVYDSNLRVNEVWKKQQNQTEEVLITKYTYNESNNVSVFYDGRTNTTYFYSYDLKGNLMQIIDSDQNKILYTYDNNSNVTKIEYTIDGETNIIYYGYDTEGNMNAVISNDIATYYEESQDPLGRYFEKTVKTNQDQPILSYNYTYCVSTNTSLSEDTNVSNLDSTRLNTEEIIIGNTKYITSYTYDSLGNIITKIQSKVNTSNNQIIDERKYCYTYDNLNQLIEEEVYKNTTLILCCNYTYDILGNITFIQRSTKLEEYQNLPSNMAYFYEDTQNKTKLTKYIIDGETFNLTYDTYNNLTNLNNYDITFIEGKITSLSVQNTDQVRYTYDATGRRIKKEIYNQNTQTYDVINYVYLNDVLIKEIHSDKTITYILDDTGVIGFKVKTSTTEDTYYYIKNTQQDIISIVNENFVEVANYIYDAYGNIVNINEVNQNEIAKLNPYRYRSYYYDTETNYYYLNARYYNPEIGRFITDDDIEYLDTENINGLNLYCYCLNNSMNYYDRSGCAPKWLNCLLIAGAAAAAIALTVVSCGSASAAIAPLAFAYLGIAANTTLALTTTAAVVTSVGIAAFAVADIQEEITNGESNYLSFLGGTYDYVKGAFYCASYMFGYASQYAQPGWGRETRGNAKAPQYSYQYGKYIRETPNGNDITIYNGGGQSIIRYDSSHIHGGNQPHVHYISWWIHDKKIRWNGPKGEVKPY